MDTTLTEEQENDVKLRTKPDKKKKAKEKEQVIENWIVEPMPSGQGITILGDTP